MITNYYDYFNIPKFSNFEKVKEQYKIIIKSLHPDKGGDTEMFTEVMDIYCFLKDKENKEKYDQHLKCIIF